MTDPVIKKATDAVEKLKGYYAAKKGVKLDAKQSPSWQLGWKEGDADARAAMAKVPIKFDKENAP